MSGRCFTLDTNILIYAMDVDAGDRHDLACQIIDKAVLCDCRLTLQAVSEFYSAVTRKRLTPIAQASAQAEDWLLMFQTIPPSASAIRSALSSVAEGRASYWDALLVATAAEAGCTTILTEDLGDGSVLHGVRILNPFSGITLVASAAELLVSG